MIGNAVIVIGLCLVIGGALLMLKFSDCRFNPRYFLTMVVGLCMIATCIEPNSGWDLFRHYRFLNEIRNSGIGFFEFVFNNTMRIGGSDYKDLVAFNIIRYVVVLLGDNRLIVPIVSFITYGSFYAIIRDYTNRHVVSGIEACIALLFSFSLLPFIFVNSGLRNSAAAAIVAYAIYFASLHRFNAIKTMVLFAIAVTIHAGVLLVIGLYYTYLLKNVKLRIVVVCVSLVVLEVVANLFYNSSIDFLIKLGSYYRIHTSGGRNISISTFYAIVVYALAIYFTVKIFWRKDRQYIEAAESGLIDHIKVILTFLIVCIGYSALALRTAYVLAFFTFPLINYGLIQATDKAKLRFSSADLVVGLVAIVLVSVSSVPEYIAVIVRTFLSA